MKKRFTEAQIIGFIREAEAGLAVASYVVGTGFLRRALSLTQ